MSELQFKQAVSFERAVVEAIEAIAKSKGFKAKPLAEKAWSHKKDPGGSWRRTRNMDPPQELSVRDAYLMAQALGMSLTDLCGIAQARMLAAPPNEVPEVAPTKRTAKKSSKGRRPAA